ncbi:hypothetical protein J3459_008625 [Metarhizium acridum]|nr:hypothetical protein J3459_008625 [Metarhizium acridum]
MASNQMPTLSISLHLAPRPSLLLHVLFSRTGKKLNWAVPVSSYLPDFNTVNDPEIGKRETLEDLLSHSTGLAPVDHAVTGFYDEYYNKGQDHVKIASHLPVAYNFRSRWLYNNTIYGVIGELIAKLTSWKTEVLKEPQDLSEAQ